MVTLYGDGTERKGRKSHGRDRGGGKDTPAGNRGKGKDGKGTQGGRGQKPLPRLRAGQQEAGSPYHQGVRGIMPRRDACVLLHHAAHGQIQRPDMSIQGAGETGDNVL